MMLLIYSLGGPDAASFTLDAMEWTARARVQLKTKVALDHETKDEYTVTVTATDPSGATDRITVTIMVTDVDEGPAISEAKVENFQL